ncbi:hypothetical protein CFK37_10825 [Virgibacillus phasianinus]|uniref:Uncharacterized protein n=1 Tax=Virgibacillus phasianinus TaxID=2017483 RepID=A0A220U466_9BACI|nr:hypothetical protein [Virgibacillus phasianinus]ASK62611.1 hypothetical protein CFK37_10825 [Virgibacillus phasianinus]
MVIKNGATLSKDYFQSYFKLRMNTLGCSLDQAREQTYEEFFGENAERFGRATYQHFIEAYQEMDKKT